MTDNVKSSIQQPSSPQPKKRVSSTGLKARILAQSPPALNAERIKKFQLSYAVME